MKIPVLIFGGNEAALGTVRALAHCQIPLYIIAPNNNCMAAQSRFVTKTFKINYNADTIIENLRDIKKILPSAVIMVAGDDYYLDLLAQKRESIPNGFIPMFPDWETVKKIRHKHLTYQICSKIGIPFPKTSVIKSRKELEDLNLNKLNFPLLMKAHDSKTFLREFKTKGIIVNSPKEILENYDSHNEFYGELLLSEYISGDESNLVNLIACSDEKGLPIEFFMNRKVMVSREFSNCIIMENYFCETLLKYSLMLMKELGYYGYFNPEFKIDPRDGKLKLMEVNGRITLSHLQGLCENKNIVLSMYKQAVKELTHKEYIKLGNANIKTMWIAPVEVFRKLVKQGLKAPLKAFAQLIFIGKSVIKTGLSHIITDAFWSGDIKMSLIMLYKKLF